jgi:hypothetical protein
MNPIAMAESFKFLTALLKCVPVVSPRRFRDGVYRQLIIT